MKVGSPRRGVGLVIASFHSLTHNKTKKKDISALTTDIKALEMLNQQLFMNMDDLYMEKERLIYSKTWQGKYFNMMGYVFSVYCVWKIFSVKSGSLVPPPSTLPS